MDAALLLGLFVALAVTAARWGHDSREGIGSKEQDLAACGVSWQELADARGREHAGYTRRPVAGSKTVRNRGLLVLAADVRLALVGRLVTLSGPGSQGASMAEPEGSESRVVGKRH